MALPRGCTPTTRALAVLRTCRRSGKASARDALSSASTRRDDSGRSPRRIDTMITTAYGPTPPQARLLAPLFLAFSGKRL